MRLTDHFTLEEFVGSPTAMRLGIDNSPPAAVRDNIKALAEVMEAVRAWLGWQPIHISSGYRSSALNSAIGGAKTSAHLQGLAADFVCPGFGVPREIVLALSGSSIQFDQLIHEGRWVHLAISPGIQIAPRREVLTAHFAAGRVTYTKGVA